VDEFNRELAGPDRGQIYLRECWANTWYALGAVHLRRGNVGAATSAFRRALEIGPGHVFSMAALGLPIPALAPSDPRIAEANIARAIALARRGRHRDAADVYRETVLSGPAANTGWLLPVEPILRVSARPEIWGDVLAIVRQRAT
jgi:tetratricopeptide (TPR) repeat protein